MGLLEELENMKCRPVIDLIKNDELYDKKSNVLSGLEVFELLHNRFKKLIEIIQPLKEKIGNIEIVDIDFGQGMQEDANIVIKYIKDEKSYYVSISNISFEQVELSSTDKDVENEAFVHNNKRIFLNIFRNIDESSLDRRIVLNSTTKKFIITDLANIFTISDIDSKIFSIVQKHHLFEKENILYDASKLSCNYSKLRELIDNEENILKIYQHLHIYEDDIDKVLIKKLT